MIVLVLRFGFRPGTDEPTRDRVLELMRRTANVESVVFSTVGPLIGGPVDGLSHAYTVAIPGLAALERYLHEPVHLAGDPEILPHFARLTHVRFSDDPDPRLAEKIAELVEKKIALYPEWGDLVASVPQ
ncbi:antibiotic biosynthesis monooxygenase family protein [Actinomadura macrotermitis]|uniref:Stress-response A/B barrel domain-containing protein n=1 Tax=Actinomadura macrotermitis TaxID=2585200 RepID=A0A7K0BQA4_9ACTN|nr:Dabb family protein [Actinomadura macrotermitis]MQY03317.1 hypothetical protein [Actinomadura macrotermitis]